LVSYNKKVFFEANYFCKETGQYDGRGTVKKWLTMSEEELAADKRGWQEGRLKRHSQEERERIIAIRQQLEQQGGQQPFGSRIVKSIYKERYGEAISEWFINKTIKAHKEASADNWVRGNGQEEGFGDDLLPLLKRWGRVIMSIEFISLAEMEGEETPTYLLACKYIYPYQLAIVSRIESRTTDEVVKILKHTWSSYKKPDLVLLGYHRALGVNLSHRGCLGRLGLFFLNLGILPFYAPAPQSRIETGTVEWRSLLAAPFYRYLTVPGQKAADYRIESFYLECRKRGGGDGARLKIGEPLLRSIFAKVDVDNKEVGRFGADRIFFLQAVKAPGVVKILAVDIELDRTLIGATVCCELNVKEKKARVYRIRSWRELDLILEVDYWINNIRYS
jgi:hypothetical protein